MGDLFLDGLMVLVVQFQHTVFQLDDDPFAGLQGLGQVHGHGAALTQHDGQLTFYQLSCHGLVGFLQLGDVQLNAGVLATGNQQHMPEQACTARPCTAPEPLPEAVIHISSSEIHSPVSAERQTSSHSLPYIRYVVNSQQKSVIPKEKTVIYCKL